MNSSTRRAKLALLIAVGGALFGGVSRPAASATGSASRTWQLMDHHLSACFSSDRTDIFFPIWINGRWTHAVDVGAQGLPPGGSYTTIGAPIPPGSSDGGNSPAYVRIHLAPNTPLGAYTARLWATDGRSRQTVPVTLFVKVRCGY